MGFAAGLAFVGAAIMSKSMFLPMKFCFTVVVPIDVLLGLTIAVFVLYTKSSSAFRSGLGLQHRTWACFATRGKVMMIVPLLAYMLLIVVCICK